MTSKDALIKQLLKLVEHRWVNSNQSNTEHYHQIKMSERTNAHVLAFLNGARFLVNAVWPVQVAR